MQRATLLPHAGLLWSSHSLRPRLIPAPSTSRAVAASPSPSLSQTRSGPESASFAHSAALAAGADSGKDDAGSKAEEKGKRDERVESKNGNEDVPVTTPKRRGRPRKSQALDTPQDGQQATETVASESLAVRKTRRTRASKTAAKEGKGSVEGSKQAEQDGSNGADGDDKTVPPSPPSRPAPVPLSAQGAVRSRSERAYVDPESPGFQLVRAREAEWETNPWMHMLASPLRMCSISRNILPSDLMICFKQVRLPNASPADTPSSTSPREGKSRSPVVIMPDRILHPKFALRKVGVGVWVLGARTMLEAIVEGRDAKRLFPSARPPARLVEMVEDQLRERVLQEAELLRDHVVPVRSALRGPTLSSGSGGGEGGGREVALLDLRADAPAMRQEEAPGRVVAAQEGSFFGQPPHFGLRVLMGYRPPPAAAPSVNAGSDDAEGNTETDAADEADASADDLAQTNAKADERVRALLHSLRQCEPLVALGSFPTDDAELAASSVIPVFKHKLSVPLIIALHRLARFVQS